MKKLLRKALAMLDVGLYRRSQPPLGHLSRLDLLKSQGITAVLDAGANVGQYSRQLRDFGYKGRIVSFEPVAESFKLLEQAAAADPEWECKQWALGDQDGEIPFNLSAFSVCNSFLQAGEDFDKHVPGGRHIEQRPVSSRRVDSISESLLKDDDRVWLKLDVEGFENQVLDGAPETLKRVRVVETEMALLPLFEGEPLFFEISERLYSLGFVLIGLSSAYIDPSSGQMLRIDGVFVRQDRRSKTSSEPLGAAAAGH